MSADVSKQDPRTAAPAPSRRRWVRLSAALLVLGSATLLLGCGTLARTFVFWIEDDPLPQAGTVLDTGWRVVEYEAEGGVTLRGAVLRHAGSAPRPTVLWFHGTGDCAAHNLARAKVVFEGGLDVFVAEYRGFGGCSGTPSEAGLIADGHAALQAVKRELGVDSREVIILGISLGTGVASALAAEGEGRAIVLVAPYTSIRAVVNEFIPGALTRFCVPELFDSLPRLKRSSQPLLVVHGTADKGVPFAHGERIARELGDRARLVPLQGAGHDDTFEVDHWRQIRNEVSAFVRS